jgi:hypothetical protein
MTAPFPSNDSTESPYALIAMTFANILAPHSSSNGAVLNTLTGIVQLIAVDDVMSQ